MLVLSIVSAAALVLGSASLQPDPTRAPREAFGRCLLNYTSAQANERATLAEFEARLPEQCMTEERAFREAFRAHQAAMRVPQAEIDEVTTMEIEDYRANTKARFEDAITPR